MLFFRGIEEQWWGASWNGFPGRGKNEILFINKSNKSLVPSIENIYKNSTVRQECSPSLHPVSSYSYSDT